MNAPNHPIKLIKQSAKAESAVQIFLTLSSDLWCIWGQDGYFNQLNPAWEKVLGWTDRELRSQPWIEFIHPDDVKVTLRAATRCSKEELVEYENRYRHKDGSYCWLSWRVSQAEDGLVYGVAKDITAAKYSENALRDLYSVDAVGAIPSVALMLVGVQDSALVSATLGEENCSLAARSLAERSLGLRQDSLSQRYGDRIQFEKLITTLSTEFINLSFEDIDAGINHALQIIAEFAGCDRSYVVLFSEDGCDANLAYEWYTESIEPLSSQWQRFSTESFPWWMGKLSRFEPIQVSTLAELPPEANNTRIAMQSLGSQSLVAVPMVQGKSLIGYIGFDAVKDEKRWPEDIVALLRMVGEIFTSALNRKQADSKLRESERRFRAIFDQTFQFTSLLKPDGTLLEANQTALSFGGIELSDIVDRPFWEARWWTISPETQERLRAAITEAAAGNLVRYEVDLLGANDTVATIDFSLKPVKDETGQVVLLISEGRDISEAHQELRLRQQAESALRESEQRWQLALRGNNDSIWDFNFKTNQCFHSARWGEMLGYEEHEVSNYWDEWEARVHPDDIERVMQVRQEHLERKTPYYIAEYRIRCKDGSYKWILSRAQALWDEAGNPVRMVGSHTDISERKQAEAELQKAYQQLTLHVDNSPVAVIEWDREFRLQRWSRQAEKIFGWKAQDLLNKCPGDWHFIYEEDVESVYSLLHRLLNGTQELAVDQNRNYAKDGRIVYCEWYNSVLLDESGNVESILSLVLDISERKQAEEALQQAMVELERTVEQRTAELTQANEQLQLKIAEQQLIESALSHSEEQFRRVFDEAPIGMSLESLDYRFIRVNSALFEMLGYTGSELMALSAQDIVHPEDWAREFPYLEQLKRGEIDSYQLEERLFKKNQEILWVNLTTTVLRDQAGEILYILGMVEDITKRKQAEAEVHKALSKERELNELKSRFINMVSHEFRNPLTTIQSSAQLLQLYNHILSDEKKQKHHRQIQSAVKRMTQLVDDVLTIGKAEAGKLNFEPAPMDLVAFCRDIVESIQISAAPEHAIIFVTSGGCTDAQMDEKLLGHIVTNLLSNAIKYSPLGGSVEFDLVCTSSNAIFRIRDTGIGIPSEDLKQLFESFGRASNVGSIPGTGLGLAIVKKCVDLHRGEIAVESEVGVGTTFTVTLPLHSQ
jgi:PAS domain S-box-containing protein